MRRCGVCAWLGYNQLGYNQRWKAATALSITKGIPVNFLFDVTVERLKDAEEVPGVWTDARYRQLLALLDFEEGEALPAEEVPEMTLMAMQDVDEPHDAAEQVLDVLFGEELSAGMRQQLAHKFDEAEAWEEHGDMSHHARIFAAADILHRAYPKQFVRPVLAHLEIDIAARNPESSRVLDDELPPAFLVRLLADGMDENSSLHRLFADQLAGNSFPEAPHILWRVERDDVDSPQESTNLHLYSSWNWFGPLKGLKQFESTAHPDEELSD